jgi:hypothetical protein
MRKILKWLALIGYYGVLGGFCIFGSCKIWAMQYGDGGEQFLYGVICGAFFIAGMWLLTTLIGEILQSILNRIRNNKKCQEVPDEKAH